MTKIEHLAQIDADILAQRKAHASLNQEVFAVLKQKEELDLKITFLTGLKEIARREMARLHKQKSRARTGRN